jgi:uncharacterized protein DUF6636
MWRLAAGLAAVVLVVGCGSDKKPDTAAKTPPSTTTSTLPEVAGKTSTEKKASPEPKPARTGQAVEVVDFLAFKTPSGKIGCAVTKDPTTLRCDTKYETSFSRSGHKCTEGDYGHSFEVLPSGNGMAICAGDTVLSATNSRTIPYGKTWMLGPFRCIAKTSGLSCVNGAGHGFSLSVQSQRLF